MTVSETLIQTWSAVVAEASQTEGNYHRRIPLASSWPAHAGIHRPTEARILILETESKAVRALHLKDETKGYSIDLDRDEAGRVDRAAIRIKESTPNEFDGWGFTLRQFDVFCVGEGFPRLLESNVPPGVSEIAYTLNLSSAAAFQVVESDFWARIVSSYG